MTAAVVCPHILALVLSPLDAWHCMSRPHQAVQQPLIHLAVGCREMPAIQMQGLKTLLGQEADLRKIEPNLYLNEKLRREVRGFQLCTSAAVAVAQGA